MESFGIYLKSLRKKSGLTLKQVEKAAKVSNAYISLVERGQRRPPHPDILNRLAKVYEVSQQEVLIAAGYLQDPKAQQEREDLEKAYQHATSDPKFHHGTRLKGTKLSLEAKRFIVEMYESATKRKLLAKS